MSAPAPDLAILVEWAIFSRPDWEADRVEGAVLAAKGAQWPDSRIGLFLVRMVWDTAATPWDLTNAARQPQGTASTVPASPEVITQRMAEMRSALPHPRERSLTGAALAAHQALEARLAAARTDRMAETGDGAE